MVNDRRLTRRQIQILNLIKTGKWDREIAKELGISTQTVKTHVHLALLKLQARNRTEVVIKAVSHGYIQLTGSELPNEPTRHDDLNITHGICDDWIPKALKSACPPVAAPSQFRKRLLERLMGEVEAKGERTFSVSSNNKGLPCPFKPILCQEGYCHGCQIYLDGLREKGSNARGGKLTRQHND